MEGLYIYMQRKREYSKQEIKKLDVYNVLNEWYIIDRNKALLIVG